MYELFNSSIERVDRLLPLEFTLGDPMMKNISDQLAESCRQLHQYTLNIRRDFTANPSRYYLNIPGGRNLYNKFAEGLIQYSSDNSHLYLTKDELDNVFWKHHKGVTQVYEKHGLTLEIKLLPLEYMGYKVEYENERYIFSNPAYPNMFMALRLLRDAAQAPKLKNYGEYILNWRDFRILVNPRHRQTAIDIISVLPENLQSGAMEIYSAIDELKPRCVPYTPDFIKFVRKGKNVAVLKRDHYLIYVNNETAVIDYLKLCEPEIQEYIFKHLNYCRNCRPVCKWKKQYNILIKNIKTCSDVNVEIKNLDNPKLVAMAKHLLRSNV